MQEYVPKEIEAKWQKYWEEHNLLDFDFNSENPKYYMLTMLPYPSGDLHIGHWYAMAPSDCHASTFWHSHKGALDVGVDSGAENWAFLIVVSSQDTYIFFT